MNRGQDGGAVLPLKRGSLATSCQRYLLGVFLVLASCVAQAVTAPPYIEAVLPQARLSGEGKFSWYGFSVYQAQLWVGAQGYLSAQPDAAPFVLDLRYARAFEGKKIAQASFTEMEKIGAGDSAQRQSWLTWMQQTFPDVQEGSHLSGVYLPTAGARFYLDGKLLASTSDRAFARAFFAIWLAPATSAKSLRSELLRDAAALP